LIVPQETVITTANLSYCFESSYRHGPVKSTAGRHNRLFNLAYSVLRVSRNRRGRIVFGAVQNDVGCLPGAFGGLSDTHSIARRKPSGMSTTITRALLSERDLHEMALLDYPS
jgi:hypothetical protein